MVYASARWASLIQGDHKGSMPFHIRRFASQMKPIQECHPERSEGSLAGQRSFAALRMTKRDGLLFEMYWPVWPPVEGVPLPCPGQAGATRATIKALPATPHLPRPYASP